MEEVKFERTMFSINLYGEKFGLRAPSLDEAMAYAKKSQGIDIKDDDAALSLMATFLDNLGLPEEKVKKMELSHVIKCMDMVMPKQKK